MTASHSMSVEPDIETSVRAQAKVRAKLGVPVLSLGLISVWYWGTPYGPSGQLAVWFIAFLHVLYIFSMLYLSSRFRPFRAAQLVVATAILDPMMLSAWLAMMGESGRLFVCFYLFTVLGFGFRIGPKPMWICQIASIIGFSTVVAIAPIWQQLPFVSLSFLILLIVVPMYATVLIKKLRDARAHAERESQAKSELLAKVSHELRTPLSGIVASAQLIASEPYDNSVPKRAETILSLSNDLLLEINDLLDSAKYQAKSLVLESTWFSLSEVLDHIHLTFASAAARKGIEFNVRMDDDICDMVQGDSHYLNRVLMNIAGNAVKFTEKGRVDVYFRLVETGADYYRVRFSVHDTGIGIPEELHASIFEPFFQASGGTTRKYGGTGLGMSIAKEIVTLMGGDLLVESEPGKGSHFYFNLKLPKAAKAPQKNVTATNVSLVYGKKILVADDNATNLILIKELLEKDRHQVTAASTGQEALEILSSTNFDLIFLDYNMGDIDGLKVLQIYRFGRLNPAPVFFLTADTTSGTAEKLQDGGAMGTLHKPISKDGLRSAIAGVFKTEAVMLRPESSQASLKPVPSQYIDHAVIVDLQALCPRPEFLSEVLENAVLDTERNCRNLLTALDDENVTQIHDSAHALKGVSDSIGAVRLSVLAKKLMKITSGELKPNKERLRNDIKETGSQSVSCIKNILADHVTACTKM